MIKEFLDQLDQGKRFTYFNLTNVYYSMRDKEND